MLRIHGLGFARGNGKEGGIEVRNVAVEKVSAFDAGLHRMSFCSNTRREIAAYRPLPFSARVIIRSSIPSLWRDFAPSTSPLNQELPEAF